MILSFEKGLSPDQAAELRDQVESQRFGVRFLITSGCTVHVARPPAAPR